MSSLIHKACSLWGVSGCNTPATNLDAPTRKLQNIKDKHACDSVRREVLYNIVSEFGIPKKLVRLIKMCLTEM